MSVTLEVDDEAVPGLGADGRPDPDYAARLGLVAAATGRRAGAFAIDAAIWAVLSIPSIIGYANLLPPVFALVLAGDPLPIGGLFVPLVLVIVGQSLTTVFGVVQLILHGRKGVTVGKASLGIRSVNVAGFGPAGFWRIVLRALVLWGGQTVLPIAGPAVLFASGLWDPEQRGRSWLDRIAKCWAVDARGGLDPFDTKAMRHARRGADAVPAAVVQTLPSLATGAGRAPFIPGARSASGVIAPFGGGQEWTPPPLPGFPAAAQAFPGETAIPVNTSSFPGGTLPFPAETGYAPAPVTAAVPVQPPAPAWPAAPPAPVPAPASAPVVPAVPAQPASARSFVLAFDDGSRIDADPGGLLGRSPSPRGGSAAAQLIPLRDETMQISKTHLEFGVDEEGFWVLDHASTNGSTVTIPGGRPVTLVAGERRGVEPGSTVELGGRSFTLQEVAR
ncbi:RDD family protein [Agromyces archimandritae]|uniref:RDD family protein n=1 Tax=Agromyces archimandritae TaxID=2781962 RepID=A0A975FPM7_9MICO|nr:RDD family protein [Agromyces archimandritae]QTX05507.1 RDD family protein [Agromyces archimandritae]